MHDLISELTEYLNLTPEQQFRVSAKIKRHIHDDKAGLLYRLYLGCAWGTASGKPEFEGVMHKHMSQILKDKYESHKEWANKPDEEIITWSVGSFKYIPPPPKCYPENNYHTFIGAKVGDKCICGKLENEIGLKEKE